MPLGYQQLIFLLLPLDGQLHFFHWDTWIFKNAIDLQGPFFYRCLDIAALCVHVEADVCILNAWPVFGGRAGFSALKIEVIKPAVSHLHLVRFVCASVFFPPLNVQRVDQATDFVFKQGLAGGVWQWQLECNASKRKQV